jgi:hypothetical protein
MEGIRGGEGGKGEWWGWRRARRRMGEELWRTTFECLPPRLSTIITPEFNKACSLHHLEILIQVNITLYNTVIVK